MEDSSYRPSKVVENTIRDTSTVLFDDELYPQAINFLSSLLHAGGGNESRVLALVPYSQQLALLSTVIVHPLFTNRSSSAERSTASNLALRLLHDVTIVAGPVAADFATAFAFTAKSKRRDGRRRQADTESDDGDIEKQLENKYAKDESVWAQAEDFWQIVGWAFNCSIREPKRWERWRLWLEWMLDALEADWAERVRQAREFLNTDKQAAKELLMKSMVFGYLKHLEGRNGRRRIMRAILATGEQKDLNEFPEVWKNETKERKRKSEEVDTRPRKKLNLDEDDFGDYGVEEDDEDAVESSNEEDGDATLTAMDEDEGIDVSNKLDLFETGTSALGGIDAVSLRHRLMALLYRVALDLPLDFTYVEELCDLYTECIKPLELSKYSILASNPYLHPQGRIALLVNHMLPILSSNNRLKDGYIFKVDQKVLEQDLLTKAANGYTTVDNAKISLALEGCLIALVEQRGVNCTAEFSKAVEDGIRARKKQAISDNKRGRRAAVDDDRNVGEQLELSGQRLIGLLEVLRASSGVTNKSTRQMGVEAPTSSLSEPPTSGDDDD